MASFGTLPYNGPGKALPSESSSPQLASDWLLSATHRLLVLFSEKSTRRAYLSAAVELLKDYTDCRCIGVRLINPRGELPYEAFVGFSEEFWQRENWLSLSRDHCACVRVVAGAPEPQDLAALTPAGSFCAADLQSLFAGLTEQQRTRFRGQCVASGFVSLAIVPIRHGPQILGALHLADERPGLLTPEAIRALEGVALLMGEAMQRFNLEEELARNHDILARVNHVIRIGQDGYTTDEFLALSLQEILGLPWLSSGDRGAIFLMLEGRGKLRLAASRGLSSVERQACCEVELGRCLCGRAAESQTIQYAHSDDERHEIHLAGTRPHGHYCLPIVHAEQTLGVITVEVPTGHHVDHWEETFLCAAADALAISLKHRESELKLREHHERLLVLTRQLVDAQENERRSIARELHDEAGQSLTALQLGLGLLQRHEECTPSLRAQIEELKRVVDVTAEGLHRLATALRPASLDRLGLLPALRQHVDSIRLQNGLAVELVTSNDSSTRLPPQVETCIYRIVQEALTNVVRHAHATRAGIILGHEENRVSVIVEDDGVGFDPGTAAYRGRLGLLGMQERAEMFGGSITIESQPGRGTTVYVEIPL